MITEKTAQKIDWFDAFWQILTNTFRVKMLVIWKNLEIE